MLCRVATTTTTVSREYHTRSWKHTHAAARSITSATKRGRTMPCLLALVPRSLDDSLKDSSKRILVAKLLRRRIQ